MKKITALALMLVLMLTLAACGAEQDSDVPAGMKEVTTDAATFDMFVPESWIVDLQTGAASAHVSDDDRSNVSVMVWGLERSDDTVDAWWELHLDELAYVFPDMSEVKIENGEIVIRQGNTVLSARLIEKRAHPLLAPISGAMSRTIHESASCRAAYCFQQKGRTLLSFETSKAAFEYEY